MTTAQLPQPPQPAAWMMTRPGCDGSADWAEIGQALPEPEPGFVAVPLYDQSAIGVAVAAERERIIAALLAMHDENKMRHNYYGCLARLMQDGRL